MLFLRSLHFADSIKQALMWTPKNSQQNISLYNIYQTVNYLWYKQLISVRYYSIQDRSFFIFSSLV